VVICTQFDVRRMGKSDSGGILKRSDIRFSFLIGVYRMPIRKYNNTFNWLAGFGVTNKNRLCMSKLKTKQKQNDE